MASRLQGVFLVVFLGILLVVIGSGVDNSWLCLIGSLFFTSALFWGGFFLSEETVPIRVTMIAIAGLAVWALISSGSMLSLMPF